MKKAVGTIAMATVLIFAVSVIAADKVVVVPLGGKKSTGDALAADVLEGKTFSNKDEVGIVGTIPTQILNAASTTLSAGFYNATTLESEDVDFKSDHILKGVTIFGIEGNYMCPGNLGAGIWYHCYNYCFNQQGILTSSQCVDLCDYTMIQTLASDCQ